MATVVDEIFEELKEKNDQILMGLNIITRLVDLNSDFGISLPEELRTDIVKLLESVGV